MRQVFRPLNSHFETPKQVLAVLLFTLFCSFLKANELPKTLILSRPSSIEITQDEHSLRWINYFQQLKTLDSEKLSLELAWLATEFRYWGQRGNKASPFFTFLNSIRNDLPLETRWLLSAIEIQNGSIREHTANDAIQALERLNLTEEFNLLEILKTPRLSTEVFYTLPGDAAQQPHKIRLYSLDTLVDYFSSWHKLPLLLNDHTKLLHLEERRLRWFAAVINLTRDFDIARVGNIVSLFSDSKLRTFQNSEIQYEFYKFSLFLFEKIQLMHGRFKYDHTQGLSFGAHDERKISYQELTGQVKQWLSSDVSFMIEHFFKLKSLNIFALEDFFNRPPSASEARRVKKILELTTSEIDSKLAAGLYLLRYASFIDTNQTLDIVDQLIGILGQAKARPTGIEIFSKSSSVVVSADSYYQLLGLFFDLLKAQPAPKATLWSNLVSSPVIKYSKLSDADWKQLEIQRFDCLLANLGSQQIENYLFNLITKKIPVSQELRILAGEYLRKSLKTTDLTDFTLRVLSATGSNWEKNSGELVYVIHSLNPQEPTLLSYLSEVYSKKILTSAISSQEALRLLGLSRKQGDRTLKHEMLKRLTLVGVGDTAGTFSAFVRMYPSEVIDMATVIYRHRSAPEKLKKLLHVLIMEASENKSVIESFFQNLTNHPDKAVAGATYQGLTLDKWLNYQVNKLSAAKCLTSVGGS